MDIEDPTEQVKVFETLITQKTNEYFPLKLTKLGVGDAPFMNSELKALKRKRMNEYKKHLKSPKYFELLNEFE